jgi:hypothetical protein
MKLLEIEGEGDLECMVFMETKPNLKELHEKAVKEGNFGLEGDGYYVTISAYEFEGLTKEMFNFFQSRWQDYDNSKDHDIFIVE